MGFFTIKGRLRRRSYWLRVLLLGAVGIGVYALPTLLPTAAGTIEMVAAVGLVLVYYLVVVQAVQRLHDLNLSGWWALLGLLPLVSYVLGAGVQLVQGTIGPNRFGPDPKRPALSVSVAADLPPLVDQTPEL